MDTPRQHFEKRKSLLKNERQSFIEHYRELSDFVSPRRGRFLMTDRNKGDKRYGKIINSQATLALRTLTSGMMAGITSPARPWFRLATPDPDMMEYEPVKLWLNKVESIMREIFNQSNLYNALPVLYRELGLFGTGCLSQVDDFKDVARFYPYTVGSYMIAAGERGEVDTMYREFEMTVGQIVEKFGARPDRSVDWSRISPTVKSMYERGSVDSWVPVVHAIEPNTTRNVRLLDAKNKPFRSVYYEAGSNNDKLLRASGFDDFPTMAPRWDVTNEDIYGTDCPGMAALGDVKALQTEEKRKAQAIDKMVNPPLKGPGTLTNKPISALPGGITLFQQDPNTQGLEPLYEVKPELRGLLLDIQAVEQRIDRAFYADLFLAISQMEGVQPRNVMELAERKEEKLLMLGPVLERLHGELLNKLIDRTFAQMVAADILPPPPDELQGSPLKVEYISVLAQAQRAVGTAAIDRMALYITGLVQGSGDPSYWDKFDADQSIDEYGEMIGISPKVIRSDDKVEGLRAERAKQNQAAQLASMAKPASDAMNAVSQAAEIANGDQGGPF
ncbi:MAG: portal protein [Rhodospirillaceae bacterium]